MPFLRLTHRARRIPPGHLTRHHDTRNHPVTDRGPHAPHTVSPDPNLPRHIAKPQRIPAPLRSTRTRTPITRTPRVGFALLHTT